MSTTAATGTWNLDTIHSTASFAVKHMGVSTYRTSFKSIEASVELDGGEPKLVGKVPVESIDVADDMLRGHLLSPDFFDAANHPYITFESTGASIAEGGDFEVEGNLTVKGITQPVRAKGSLSGPVVDVAGKLRVGVELEAVVEIAVHLEFTYEA
jgi:polyisoprenoid-binding protein YceI